ncbi:MAG TPA: acyl carrier protein [Stellaceae bacterium]|nr:acyl carrier protein [Stellaceae bacterium]
MNEKELKATVLKALASVVPELDEAHLAPEKNFREQLDIDSMDFLNYVIALCAATKIEIPEADYRKIASVDGTVAYLAQHQKRSSAT